jgi:hypothetical protein
LYSDVLAKIIGPDGNGTPLMRIAAGDTETVTDCPFLDLAIAAWEASYNNLVYLGKIEPPVTYVEILQNVPPSPPSPVSAVASKSAGIKYG